MEKVVVGTTIDDIKGGRGYCFVDRWSFVIYEWARWLVALFTKNMKSLGNRKISRISSPFYP